MPDHNFSIAGLNDEQVIISREKYGANNMNYKKESGFISLMTGIVKDPMVILLLVAAIIYFISGKTGDGIFLSAAIVFQASISLYQNSRSRRALDKLKAFSQPGCKVIRNHTTEEIRAEEIVVGDSLVVEEGSMINADAVIIHSNDFSVNESILTGESLPVPKDADAENNRVFSGTTVATGLAIARVTSIGNETELGKIGKSLSVIREEKTPLEIQIGNFVKRMALAGIAVFIIVWIINYLHSLNFLNSLLQSLTLAMSILPEEIPVAFTTFMALGAWRLMKMGIIVKQMKTVETLGSATVICTDKTGTITQNKMSLAKLFLLSTGKIFRPDEPLSEEEKKLITLAMWASEPIPFDPMEIALHERYGQFDSKDERPGFKLIHEYPLGGKPPMMTHIFADDGAHRIIAAKGAPEAIIKASGPGESDRQKINEAVGSFTTEGYRVLGVAEAFFTGDHFPENQQDFKFHFKGIIAFYDPPKTNIKQVLQAFYDAGISVKIITGDNAGTTAAIAKQIGMRGPEKSISGDELMKLPDEELGACVMKTNLFTGMFPDAKLKIINALKSKGQVVAMTGDGVNDGPALKAAHIGIAMGRKGTEIAKEAASLILPEDDLTKMVDAVAMGRKIYVNLKKAIRYIISIHIPIILTVFIPLALGWIYPNIFSPIHIIFFELIMGPTCSVIYENEPPEQDAMHNKPKHFTTGFLSWKELSTSMVQGLLITAATLSIYQYSVSSGYDGALTRTMVFTVLITANIFLTLINRSFYYSLFTTLKYKNNMVPMIIFITAGIVALLLYVKPLTVFFEFERLNPGQLFLCMVSGFLSVIWYEIVKLIKRAKRDH